MSPACIPKTSLLYTLPSLKTTLYRIDRIDRMASLLNNNASVDEYNTTKWGRVLIFTGDNYASFAQSCTIALVNAKAWSIVNETKDIPDPIAANIAAIARRTS